MRGFPSVSALTVAVTALVVVLVPFGWLGPLIVHLLRGRRHLLRGRGHLLRGRRPLARWLTGR